MGYLQDFVAKLEELMRTLGLTEEHREEIGAYVKKHRSTSLRATETASRGDAKSGTRSAGQQVGAWRGRGSGNPAPRCAGFFRA
jgi:hypothetical protein